MSVSRIVHVEVKVADDEQLLLANNNFFQQTRELLKEQANCNTRLRQTIHYLG